MEADAAVAASARGKQQRDARPPPPEDTTQRVRVQNRLTRRDLVPRMASVTTAFLLGSYFLDAAPLLWLFGVFLLTEAGYAGLRSASDRGSREACTLLLVSAFTCGLILTALSLMLLEVPNPVARTIAVAILLTSLMHCIIIRTAWVAFGIVTALPFVVGIIQVVLELVPLAALTSVEFAIGATAITIAVLYIGKSIWEMNTTRRQLLEANEAVRRASRERSRFFAAVSHEIRTPLNAICGMAELLADDGASDLSSERANLLLRSARSLHAIVDEVLDQARLESGKHVLKPREADFCAEIQSAIEIFRPEAEAKGLELQVDLSSDLPRRAVFDAQKTRQVISNLVCNAIKYTEAGAIAVRVNVEQRREGLVLTAEVADTGLGLNAEDRHALFLDYERGGADAANGIPGTGLGLAISRRFARMMDGDIEVASEPGKGATFRFTARIGAAASTASIASRAAGSGDNPLATGSAERGPPRSLDSGTCATSETFRPAILLVDDSASNRYVARAFLKGFAGRVDEARNGQEALELVGQNPYDVMLLDMNMPVLDGPSTLRALRAGPFGNLPVVILTASADPSASTAFEGLDIQGSLSKPVRKSHLISAIKAAVATSTAPAASVMAHAKP